MRSVRQYRVSEVPELGIEIRVIHTDPGQGVERPGRVLLLGDPFERDQAVPALCRRRLRPGQAADPALTARCPAEPCAAPLSQGSGENLLVVAR
jgi:hypothetical protein